MKTPNVMALYQQYKTVGQPVTAQEVDDTLARVLARAGEAGPESGAGVVTRRGRPIRLKKRLLLAVAALLAFCLAAAGVLTVSGLFRGVLQEPGPGGVAGPLSAMAPLVDKTGQLPGQQAEAGGLTVKLRGVVGDEASLKLLLDVEGPQGKPLALPLPGGGYAQGALQFGGARLVAQDGSQPLALSFSSRVIDSDPTDNHATLLLEYLADASPLLGQSFDLHLTDLMQMSEGEGRPLGLDGGALAGLVQAFAGAEKKLTQSGYQEDGVGNRSYSYSLSNDGGEPLPLAEGITVTNAAVQEGIFYLRGRFEDEEALASLTQMAELRNAQGGTVGRIAGYGWGDDGSWEASFTGLASPEALAGLDWVSACGEDFYPLAEGSWDFSFTLDYPSLALAAEPNRAFGWNGIAYTAQSVKLSPYSLQMDMTGDLSGLLGGEGTTRAWDDLEHKLSLRLKNGEVLELTNYASYMTELEGGGYAVSLTYTLDVVIDPAEVESLTAGDLVLTADELVAP